jgi:hypothetical protein
MENPETSSGVIGFFQFLQVITTSSVPVKPVAKVE